MSNPTNSSPDERLLQLLRQQRDVSPGDEYFEGLLPRIHLGLRAEMMRRSSEASLGDRVVVFFGDILGGHRVAAGLLAYAAAIVGGIFVLQWHSGAGTGNQDYQPVSLSPALPAPAEPKPVSAPQPFAPPSPPQQSAPR